MLVRVVSWNDIYLFEVIKVYFLAQSK